MPFPVTTKQLSARIEDVDTDFIIFGYDDRIMVVVTQIGALGTILHSKVEHAYGGGSTFAVNTLLGRRDEPLLAACARHAAEEISLSGSSRELVLSLGLKTSSPGALKAIARVIVDNVV